MIVVAYPEKREIAPGWWAPIRPILDGPAARLAYRVNCVVRGHRWYPATIADPSFCVHCGLARRFIDRWMGR